MTTPSADARPIPGFDGYLADTDGSIWSGWRRGLAGRGPWHRLHPTPDDLMGYLRVGLRVSLRRYVGRRVHTLVALAFIGPRPRGLLVLHRNGDHLDNRPSNLTYGTYADNAADTIAHGRMRRGAGVASAKLTPANVVEVRALLGEGQTLVAIAKVFGVTHKTISHIRDGRTWAHV